MSEPVIKTYNDDYDHLYVNAIKKSFAKALKYKSKLPSWILEIQGMSGKKYRHLINNLGFLIPNCRYLEIGSWKGSTLCSAIFSNTITSYVIDNWSEFGGPKNEFESNVKKTIDESVEPKNIKFTLDEKNYMDVDYSSIGNYNLYFYDGPHEYQDQYNALSLALNALDDEFIFICDDYNWNDVEQGTQDAISDCKLHVLYSMDIKCELIDGWNGQNSDWHNGYYIAVCKKGE